MSIKSKIQALITAANTKTGETDATLTDAVQTLVDGYGQGGEQLIDRVVNVDAISHLFSSATIPNNLTFNLPSTATAIGGSGGGNGMFNQAKFDEPAEPTHIHIIGDGIITNAMGAFVQCGVTKITIEFNTSNITNFQSCFGYCSKLEEIVGEINMSSATNLSYIFRSCNALQNVRFTINTIPLSLDMNAASALTDDTVISIANGLNETATGKTLTLHATAKAKCSTIMGNVAMDESNTYHIFTADASGTVTLENFITQTKGWTLA